MNTLTWKRSATGNWVAYDGKNHYVIDSLVCFTGSGRGKACRRYRLRVNTSAVGGASPTLFLSAVAAQKHALALTNKFYHGKISNVTRNSGEKEATL